MPRVYRRGKRWYIDYRDVTGRRVRRAVADNRDRAQKILQDLLYQVNRQKLGLYPVQASHKILFYDLADRYLDYCRIHNVNIRDKENKVGKWRDYFGNIPLQAITAKQVEQYKQERIKSGISPSSVNREVGCLKTMLNRAVDWGMIGHNPIARVKMLREPEPRTRYLTTEEIELLLSHCAEHLKPIVLVALYTGMSRKEILNLTKEDIDWNTKTIYVRNSKNPRRNRQIPIHSDLTDTLKSIYLATRKGKRLFPYQKIQTSFEGAVRRAGLKDVTFHTLRHTFASHYLMSGGSLETLGRRLGHSNPITTMRYSHFSQKFERQDIEQMKLIGTNKAHQSNFNKSKNAQLIDTL